MMLIALLLLLLLLLVVGAAEAADIDGVDAPAAESKVANGEKFAKDVASEWTAADAMVPLTAAEAERGAAEGTSAASACLLELLMMKEKSVNDSVCSIQRRTLREGSTLLTSHSRR